VQHTSKPSKDLWLHYQYGTASDRAYIQESDLQLPVVLLALVKIHQMIRAQQIERLKKIG
jgi:hypothetical protein